MANRYRRCLLAAMACACGAGRLGFDGGWAAPLMFGKGDDNDTVRYRVGRADAPHRIGSIGAANGSAIRAGAAAATKVA